MKTPETYKILVSGGGTGGHIFPAIAIANGLKERLENVEILFVGAKGRMEMEKVPMAGYQIQGLWISGFQRRLTMKNLSVPFKLASSLIKARRIVTSFNPDAAVGTGGYASAPLLKAAAAKKVPTLILEQNSYPGVTNRLLGKSVDKVCTAYEGMEKYFPVEKIVLTGSPIRQNIMKMSTDPEEARKFFDLEKDRPTLLILGGSQGARNMNTVISELIDKMLSLGIQVIWQTGKISLPMVEKTVVGSKFRKRVKVVDFIHEMDKAYAAADILISRAGAISIAEIVQVNKPAIFVPLPSAAEDHQTHNAMSLANKNAALIVPEKDLGNSLLDAVQLLIRNPEKRDEIKANLHQFEHGNATEKIVDEVVKLIRQKKGNE
ncbi:MAG: undecaprenyldiphospho-muramoylpentapeptide beta-N-acetylglucosaminyltransferase [Bacteroidales bacterium]|nr:undecaprenyldiphospho-muramoylpentapeptide beta-N-acetylglucosaminyltransferase [Bacteroidales bacterium]